MLNFVLIFYCLEPSMPHIAMEKTSLHWDADLYQGSSSLQFELGLMAIEKLNPSGPEQILDIGCGNGLLTIELAKRIPAGHVTGIEASAEMFVKAVHNSAAMGIQNIRFLNEDALNITFDREFNAVFSNSVIHWIHDQEKAYALIFNALKPGGRIMIQTGLKEVNKLVETVIVMLQADRFRPYLAGMKLPWRFLTMEENRELLKNSGFTGVELETYQDVHRFTSIQDLSGYLESAPMVPFLSLIPEGEKDGFKEMFVRTYLGNNDNMLVSSSTRIFLSAKKP
jgi:trans-aconitate methyltransferase